MNEHTGLDPSDRELAERLTRERPLPSPAFRSRVHASLSQAPSAPRRSARQPLWQAATCTALGLLLYLVAAVGLAGAGPFSH
jgi:hypothetical protein